MASKGPASGTQLTEQELNVHLEAQDQSIGKLEKGLAEVQFGFTALTKELVRLASLIDAGIKKEGTASSADPAAPPPVSDPAADRIRVLEEQLNALRAESLLGKGKKPETPPNSSQAPPETLSKSMFLDFSEGGEGTTTADKFGEVARVLSKELKQVGSSSLKKNKMKSAASFILWEKRFRKKLMELEDPVALKRYLDFVGIVSFVARHETWPIARAYAWRWIKLDRKAMKKAKKGEAANPPTSSEISAELLMRAKLKAGTVPRDEGGKKKKVCFVCNQSGHYAAACTVPCSVCGGRGHPSSRCFRAQDTPGSQHAPGGQVGGSLLHVPPTPVCGKCGKEGHAAAQCRVR